MKPSDLTTGRISATATTTHTPARERRLTLKAQHANVTMPSPSARPGANTPSTKPLWSRPSSDSKGAHVASLRGVRSVRVPGMFSDSPSDCAEAATLLNRLGRQD